MSEKSNISQKQNYRVVQWGTGNIGTRALRTVIGHPKMTLVGVYVHSQAKEGKDAVELCGLDSIGIKATRNIDEIIADAISMPLDGYEASGEVALAHQTTRIAAGTIEAGTIAALRITVSGMRGGRPLLRMRFNWYCTTDIDPSWELRDSGWQLLLEGDTPLDVDIHYSVPPEQYATFTPGLTARRPVNAVPFVCTAEPGIRTTIDLPQIIPLLG